MTSTPSGTSSVSPAERGYQWVDTPDALARVVAELSRQPLIGIDTESDSFHHYAEQV